MIRLLFNFGSLAGALVAAHALMRGWMPGTVGQWPVMVRLGIAVVLLGLGIRGFLARAKPAATSLRRSWSGIDLASGVMILLVIHAAFLWLLVASAPVIERIGIASEPWLRPERAAMRKELADAANARDGTGNWLWHDHRSRMLPTRTDLRLSNRPEVFLRFASPDDVEAVLGKSAFLVSFSLSKFDDGIWTTPARPTDILTADEDGWTPFPSAPMRANASRIDHKVFHGSNRSGQDLLIALQGVERAEIAPLSSHDDGFVMLPDIEEGAKAFEYDVESRPMTLADLPHALPARPSSGQRNDWLDHPSSPRIAEHLRDQAVAIAGENPTAQSLITLESWLREAFDYSLVTENPTGIDPLENFLFSERRGHCEHFAMTAALMLRTIGIPTRITYGWAGGTWYGNRELMVFRAREAHAWTEVWFEDFGWVVMDPTPPGGMISNRSRIAPQEEIPPDPEEEFPQWDAPPDALRIDLIALGLLGICGLAYAALVWIQISKRGKNPSAPGGMSVRRSSSGYLAAWHAVFPPRHDGETIRQQILRLETRPPFANDLMAYHYRIQYTAATRDMAKERRLARAIRRWRKLVTSGE